MKTIIVFLLGYLAANWVASKGGIQQAVASVQTPAIVPTLNTKAPPKIVNSVTQNGITYTQTQYTQSSGLWNGSDGELYSRLPNGSFSLQPGAMYL